MARCTAPVEAIVQRALQRPALHAVAAMAAQRLQLLVVLVPVLLPVGEQWGRPEQRRRVRQQRKAELVASRFVRGVHAYRGAGTHAGPRTSKIERSCPTFGMSSSVMRGTPAGGRKGAARSARVARR